MIALEYTIPGMHVRDHVVPVPLDWEMSDTSESINIFARELSAPAMRNEPLPILLYLQGGPGGKGPRPTDPSGWIGRALKTHRVVLLDQRGTGKSSRIDAARISSFDSASQAADFLTHFRADSIVADAEHLRTTVFGGARWSTLGQSYGGFLSLTYLSRSPQGLSACYITGGLASVWPNAAEVYRRTYPRTRAKTVEFYRRYPGQRDNLASIADRLAVGDVFLPDGDLLTVRRLQSLGIDFGMKPGFERMHWLLDEAWSSRSGELSDTFLDQVRARSSYLDNPLFAVMQESIYGDPESGATAWAAESERTRHPEFAEDARPLMFTGEMIYPWMFDEIRGLRPFAAAVEELAGRTEWSQLYDRDRLASNQVPVAAAVYFDDMYVDSGLQLDTAATVGNLHAWVTNEYEHDGLHSGKVFEELTKTVDQYGGGIADAAGTDRSDTHGRDTDD
jgi:proline iminopeptidase